MSFVEQARALTSSKPRPAGSPVPAQTSTSRLEWLRRRPSHAAWLAVSVAVITCLVRVGSQPLSWDEAVTANAAHRSLTGLSALLRHTDAPLGVYYVLMRSWVECAGLIGVVPNETWLRLPSAIASIGTVAVIAVTAARLFGPLSGAASGLLLAVQPMFVFYAHDARPYAFVVLLTSAATAVFFRILDTPRPANLMLYGALAVSALYLQFLSATLILVVHAGVALLAGRQRWQLVCVLAIAFAAAAPLVVVSQRQSAEVAWVSAPTPSSVGSFLVRVAGGGAVAPVVCVVLALGVRSAMLRARPANARALGLLAGCAIVPVVSLIALSIWHPLLVPRYALVAVPALVIVTVAVLRDMPMRRVAGAIVVVALLASAGATVVQDGQPYKYEDFRAAAASIRSNERPGDGIVFLTASYRVGLAPYLSRAGRDGIVAPADVTQNGASSLFTSPTIGGDEVSPGSVAARLDAESRIFAIGSGPVPNWRATANDVPLTTAAAKEAALSADFTRVWIRRFGSVTVTLFRRIPATVRPGKS